VAFVSRRNLEATERVLGRAVPNARVMQYPVRYTANAQFEWPSGTTRRMAVVGRYDYYDKGLDILVPALARALGSQDGWQLSLFGRGADEPFLRGLVAQHPSLGSRVQWGGFADVDAIWREHHLLLQPSRREGASLAITEALLRGRPVLATDVGGASEWIADGHSGYLCAAPTEPLLAGTLARAWADRDAWEEMGKHAYDSARRKYRGDDAAALVESP
jgi:glycosyltransferase involved in cell wall biosynthesis